MRLFTIAILSLFLFCGCIHLNGTITFGDCENGYGTKCWKDGGYEIGNWKNGELFGKGYQFFGSSSKFAGDHYSGYFNHGYSGYGVYYGTPLDGTYSGFWKNGKPDGYGKIEFGNKSTSPGMYYTGFWQNGKYRGWGIWYGGDGGEWAGEKYLGYWKNNERDGFGRCYFSNGDRYDGYWKKTDMNGEGTYYFKNGITFIGYWTNGNEPLFDSVELISKNVPPHSSFMDKDNRLYMKRYLLKKRTKGSK